MSHFMQENSPTQSNKSAYFSIKDAANHLGVHVNTVYALIKQAQIPYLKISEQRKVRPLMRIPKKEFFAWLKQNER
jgi:excisionase family DNA binding protein